MHRSLPSGIKLQSIFCIKGARTITNDYTVRWRGRKFLIETPPIAIRRRRVEVREHFDGKIELGFKGRNLKHIELREEKQELKKREKKDKRDLIENKGKYIPPPDHPWRRYSPSLHHNCYLERI